VKPGGASGASIATWLQKGSPGADFVIRRRSGGALLHFCRRPANIFLIAQST